MDEMKDTDETVGLSQRELILEVRSDLKNFVKEERREHKRMDAEILQRPTRGEILSLFGAAGVLSGIIFAAIRWLGG